MNFSTERFRGHRGAGGDRPPTTQTLTLFSSGNSANSKRLPILGGPDQAGDSAQLPGFNRSIQN